MYHTKTYRSQVTSLKIGIASQVSDGSHSLVVSVAVTVISLLLMCMQVRFLCLLEESNKFIINVHASTVFVPFGRVFLNSKEY